MKMLNKLALAAAALILGSSAVSAVESWQYGWGSEWPGVAMTQVSDNLYKFELPASTSQIIFSDNGANQTIDLKNYAGHTYSTASDKYFVIFDNVSLKANRIRVYYWGIENSPGWDSAPEMIPMGNDYYYYEFPAMPTGIVFRFKVDGNDEQTKNIKGDALSNQTMYAVWANNKDMNQENNPDYNKYYVWKSESGNDYYKNNLKRSHFKATTIGATETMATNTIYFDNSGANYATPYVYFWPTDLAQEATVTASYGNAGLGVDGDEKDTRWEATVNNFSESEECFYTFDFGTAKEFNSVRIKWEAAYSEHFKFEVSDDAETWTEVLDVNEKLSNFSQYYNYKFPKQNKRYLRLNNIKRGSQWGVSFYEIKVHLNEVAPVVSAITLAAEGETFVPAGTAVTLNLAATDQFGESFDLTDYEFEVSPALGTVTNGVYTPTASGDATITIKSGDVVSNAVTVTSYTGQKINLFDIWNTAISPLNENTATGSMVGAFDNNLNSLWELHGSSDERNYTVGFVIDFGCLYDITASEITFEGASSADFTISFGDAEGNYTTAYSVTGGVGMKTIAYPKAYTDENAKGVRYVKFESTKASTQYGVKIREFAIYGENKLDIPDTTAPVLDDPTVAEVSFASVTLNLKATDDVSSLVYYEISYNDKTATHSAANGEETTYTIGGLNPLTEYTFSVVAKDAKGNTSGAKEVNTTTAALVAAAAPTHAAENVKPIYTDVYGNAIGFYTADWGSPTQKSELVVNGDHILCYDGFRYYGHIFNSFDVTDMEYLHLDVYPIGRTTVVVVPIWSGTDHEIRYVKTELVPNQWNAIDIDINEAYFNACAEHTHASVHQLKLDINGDEGGTLLVDNIYFWRNAPVADDEAPEWVKAEASQVLHNKAVLTLQATDNIENGRLTYTVSVGETVVATQNAVQGTEATVTINGLEPETDYTYTVTVADAAGNVAAEVKTISFTTAEQPNYYSAFYGDIEVQYTYTFTQTDTEVILSGEVVNNPSGYANCQIGWSNGQGGFQGVFKTCPGKQFERRWAIDGKPLKYGDVVYAELWFAVTGGLAKSEIISYTIEAPKTAATAHMHNAFFKNGQWKIVGVINGNHTGVSSYIINVYYKTTSGAQQTIKRAPAEYTLAHSHEVTVDENSPSDDITIDFDVPADKLGEGVHNIQLGVVSKLADGTTLGETINDREYSVDSSKENNTQTGVEGIATDTDADEVTYYNLNGVKISADCMQPGLYIRRQGSKTSKVIIR